ncbi:MAG: TetR/AcrR family transcriptional regulator [Bacillota bacterium]|nr:TetR/AcrR family transcriptional regulator [Bacillota bacterium]
MDDKDIIDRYLNDETLPEDELTKRHWQILEAALKVFSEKGFEGSRTSDIAREANIAEGTIFRYFKTKKDLLMGLFIPLVVKFFRPMMFKSVERLLSNDENKPIEQVLKEIFMDRLELIRKNAPLVKTIFMESAYLPEVMDAIRDQLIPKFVPVINKFFKINMDNGTLREMEPGLITRTVMSMLAGYVLLTTNFPNMFSAEDDEKEVEKIVDILLRGIKK